jgi:hypothetical protein
MDETEIIRRVVDERVSKIRENATRKTGTYTATLATGGLDIAAFISYDHADKQIMKRVNETLWRSFQIACWTDAALEPGTPSWQRLIEENLETIPCLVVLMTPNSKVSEWVASEINYGRRQDCCIFPVLADGEERNAIPLSLTNMQYIDIRQEFDGGVRRLAEAITAHLETLNAGQ